MISGVQIRAARAALACSAKDLSDRSGVSLRPLLRFEQVDEVPPSRSSTLIEIQNALEAAIIEFVGTFDDR